MFDLPEFSRLTGLSAAFDAAQPPFDPRFTTDVTDYGKYFSDLGLIAERHGQRAMATGLDQASASVESLRQAATALATPTLGQHWLAYWTDLGQRAVLYADALRRSGNHFIAHEEGALETVLSWDHVTVVDGSTLKRPVNYNLLRIVPPAGVEVREDGRPYIIIDPRAGHGSGIGGFKDESQVGAAIHQGHPTYFVTFTRLPIPGQTIADVTAAEAHFVREVRRLHPDSPKPVIIGNCQGGWAAMLLAATNADITGPLVANGAPLSYWAGQKGANPMRYMGGLVGGAAPVRMLADLGHGLFDGANLVSNFERLNPGETWWGKWYNLWDKVDTETERFVGFDRWWGSFYYMTPDEIAWIVENLFVGNRLGRGCANLDSGHHLDLRRIQSPIIIFASHGDNITPPLQALGWIRDYYNSVAEIRARGQRILYTLHDKVGHLGIFVSSAVARKEHEQIVSTLKAIEALPPGLYEMVITDEQGEGIHKSFQVAFAERSIEQMMQQAGGDDDDAPFATVARFSELGTEAYDLALRPMVQAMSNAVSAEILAKSNPMRIQRWLASDRNPLMRAVGPLAEQVRTERQAAAADNPLRQFERYSAKLVQNWWDGVRDAQDFLLEWNFHCLWAAPPVQALGQRMSPSVSAAPQDDLRTLTEVQDALDRMELGGFPAGVVRMLIFLAQSRKEVRRSRLERSEQMLNVTEPFASMPAKHRTRLIHGESLIVGFEPEAAMATLPTLIQSPEERRRALAMCLEIAGPVEEMSVETVAMFNRLAATLAQPPLDPARLAAPVAAALPAPESAPESAPVSTQRG